MHGLDRVEPARGELLEPVGAGDERPAALALPDHDAGLAVVDVERVVVAGHQQRPADVPLVVELDARVLGEPALDVPVPAAYAGRTLAVGAQQAVLVERVDRGPRRPRGRAASRTRRAAASQSGRSAASTSASLATSTNSTWSDGVRSTSSTPSASPARSASASALMSSLLRKFSVSGCDRGVRAGAVARDQVAEHRAGADRGELLRVADQHQPGLRPQRLEQPAHHRQLDHRGLVDDDHVVLEPVAAVVAEPGAVVGPPAQQPVQGHAARVPDPLGGRAGLGRGRGDLGQPGLDRLLQPGGGLAGRRGQRDRERLAAGRGLVGQQHQHPGDRGGLAGAGPAGEDRGAVPGGVIAACSCCSLTWAPRSSAARARRAGPRRPASRPASVRACRSSQTCVSSRW